MILKFRASYNHSTGIRQQAPYGVVNDLNFISPTSIQTASLAINAHNSLDNKRYTNAQYYPMDSQTAGINPTSYVPPSGYGYAPQRPTASQLNTHAAYSTHPSAPNSYPQDYRPHNISQISGYAVMPEAQYHSVSARSSYTPSQQSAYGQLSPPAPSFPAYPENSQVVPQFSGYQLSNLPPPANQSPGSMQSGHGYGPSTGNSPVHRPRPRPYGSDLGYIPPSQVAGYGSFPINPPLTLSYSNLRPPQTASYPQSNQFTVPRPGFSSLGEYGRPRMPNFPSQNAQQRSHNPNNGGSLLD